MPLIEELERKIQKSDLTINELAIRIENLNRQTEELLQELNVSNAQLAAFIENKAHFTEDNWNTLQELQQSLEAKLQRELANIRNPKKAKQTLAERNIPPHWLFVR